MKRALIILAAAGLLAASDAPHFDAAQVNSYQGILVFMDSKPTNAYTYLGTVKPRGRGWMAIGAENMQYNDIRDGLIKAAKKDYPEAEGLIITMQPGGGDHADAIKFSK